MKTFSFPKAISLNEIEIESVNIVFDTVFPDCKTLSEARSLHQKVGEELCNTVNKVLSGGTIDALLGAMLVRRGSMFIVPFKEVGNAQER